MNQLFNCISDDYRNISTIENIADEFHCREPIQYYVIDNFINTELYALVEQEFIEQESFFIHDIKNDSYVSNKTIFLWTPSFLKLYNYFLSDEFELFLEKIFQEKLQKAKKLLQNGFEIIVIVDCNELLRCMDNEILCDGTLI